MTSTTQWTQIADDDYKSETNGYVMRVEQMSKNNWFWMTIYPNGDWDSDITTLKFARSKQQAMKLALRFMMKHRAKTIKEERK